MSQTSTLPENTHVSPVRTIKIRPAVDLLEDEHAYTLQVEMPGVDQSTVSVSLERQALTITGSADFTGPEGAQIVAGLAGLRNYERQFQISDDIDRDQIDATVKNGVLTLRLPKSNRAQKISLPVKGEAFPGVSGPNGQDCAEH